MLQSPPVRAAKLFAPPFTELFIVFDSLPGSVCGVEATAYWKAFTRVLHESGEPIDAMVRVKWFDVDLDRGLLKLPDTHVERMLSPETVSALHAIEKPQRTKVFPWPGGVDSLHQAFNSLLAKAAVLAERGAK